MEAFVLIMIIVFLVIGSLVFKAMDDDTANGLRARNDKAYNKNEIELQKQRLEIKEALKLASSKKENKAEYKDKEKEETEAERYSRIQKEFAEKEAEKKALRERKNYIKSISTVNPIKWGKYTLIINKAEKKFIDIYNFQTPQEYKQVNFITSLANTLLFEEARLNKLSPDEFIELLVGFDGNRDFHKIIKPIGNILFDFEAFKRMYILYIDFRARNIRPIVSMMATIGSMDNVVTINEIEELSKEYDTTPMFGQTI
jgi:hypothetical protein